MVTGREIFSDLEMLMSNFKLSKDQRVTPRMLLQMAARKRAMQINSYYSKTVTIDPTWIQRLGIKNVTKVTFQDDLNVPQSCDVAGMVKIPFPVELDGDAGIVRVSNAGGRGSYSQVLMEEILEMDKTVEQFHGNLRWRVGDSLYIKPYVPELHIFMVLDDPMDAIYIDNSDQLSGNLFIGDEYESARSYEVTEGSIIHDSITYHKGEVFTAVATTFTGYGKIKLANRQRIQGLDDPYPMSKRMANTVIMRVLSEDYGVSSKQISDIVNDGQNQFNILSESQPIS